jgi:ADP-heptose:LPS heptosyltransferase
VTEKEKANMFHKQGRIDRAEQHYINALSENFDDKDILYFLGTIYLQKGVTGLAAQLFMRSVDLNKGHFPSWNNLGNCFKAINKEKDAEACWRICLGIKGQDTHSYADIWCNLSTLHINNGDPEKGLTYAKKCLELNPEHADGAWNLSLINLELGKYEEGFGLYSAGFRTKNRLYRNYGDKIKDWDGEKNKSIAVWGEQGLGDEILFSSMITDLQKVSKKVVFDCHPRLVSIFKESFPGVEVYGTRKDEYIEWPSDHQDINAKTAIGELGKFFRKDIKDFPSKPYLKAPADKVEKFKEKLGKLGDKPKIGISWTGGYMKTRKDFRSIDLEKWKDIFKQDADFISLQYTPEAYKVIADMEDRFDVKIHHWPSAVESFDYGETAGLVANLDLIITVNTSIHHLAGALGTPCWTLTPKAKAWRYFSPDKDNKTIPWYPTVKQYQQKQHGNWQEVMDAVIKDLPVFLKSIEDERIKEYKKYLKSIRKGKAHEDKLCNDSDTGDGILPISQHDTSEGVKEART